MAVPANPKIYHIVHVDRLASIIRSGALWCDARVIRDGADGTTIGMSSIKRRRLQELQLDSHADLYVGQCVPFYFCPRSVMLYLIYRGNHSELTYRGGQGPIVHLEADLRQSVAWANANRHRWAFTLSNAGSYYFEDRCDLRHLGDINWDAVQTRQWQSDREGKQAEFLMEDSFPWGLIERIGVSSAQAYQQVVNALPAGGHRPTVEVKHDWYY
ncbi:type II toxin-antitoxin system toxin DNA ADP-ribosyl transferase DarT [Burkholderia cenocepacia]|uniref:DarT domain-containing protein n=1 Tax=Burkholderia cenocepacia TaxID=95486 RepID=A0AAD0J9R2_9BURK|nr:DUF4433 domain-containing protein [Burkholderia cenocepacia]AWG33155.1 hypothetical protein B9Z07_31435 [Burkholderia cenocepacia]EAY61797.1 hypothetical protein BCPG_00001 [Burkholderia cenocepacia PC184]PRE38054.1 DUF4433 domain-containing protein [Burkholderia cenocepacia]HEM7883169.1 DUF4433 domain-containing protein [Burkholderia cenocepacia]